VEPPEAYEAGWKDTIVVPPGGVTRVIVRVAPTDVPLAAPAAARAYPFDPSDARGYAWHCHMLSHEDNDMMRPLAIRPNPAAPPPNGRAIQQGVDY
jgi:FtsP/CotA-like multicopper oxidase with cupredoxin domain